jgi:hypothetical protein
MTSNKPKHVAETFSYCLYSKVVLDKIFTSLQQEYCFTGSKTNSDETKLVTANEMLILQNQ